MLLTRGALEYGLRLLTGRSIKDISMVLYYIRQTLSVPSKLLIW